MGQISVDGWEPRHLSFSTLSTYRMCSTKLYLQKVLQLDEKPSLAAIGGNAVHSATEAIDRLILEQGLDALRPVVRSKSDNHSEPIPTREETGF